MVGGVHFEKEDVYSHSPFSLNLCSSHAFCRAISVISCPSVFPNPKVVINVHTPDNPSLAISSGLHLIYRIFLSHGSVHSSLLHTTIRCRNNQSSVLFRIV